MKLFFTTALSILFFTSIATAQHANIGIKGGLNAYSVQHTNSSDINPLLGFHLGLMGHIHITDQFALQPEVTFSTQGANYNEGGDDVKLFLNYVNIPLLFQYMFDNGFRLQAGPQLGVLVNAKRRLMSTEFDVTNSYEAIDLGLSLGFSYVNPESNYGWDLRYNHGLTDIRKDNNSNVFNRGIQAGVFFLLGHK